MHVYSMLFGQLSSAFFRSSAAPTDALGNALAAGPRLLDHDVVIWLGDLNYRLNLPEDAIMSLLRQQRLDLLLEVEYDNSEHELRQLSAMI